MLGQVWPASCRRVAVASVCSCSSTATRQCTSTTPCTDAASIRSALVPLLGHLLLQDSQHAFFCLSCRLLLAVCEHWRLWPAASSRLDAFLQSPKNRTKAATPNLGLLLPLLACSPARHSWAVMAAPLLQEAMDRKVLWMCKKDPGLVQVRTSR